MNEKLKRYEELRDKILKLREESISGRSQARIDTKLAEDYMMHDPFTDEEKAEAELNSKPLLRYNILRGKLQTILGNEQASRRRVEIVSDHAKHDDVTRIMNDNLQAMEERENLQDKHIKGLADGLCYKLGGWIKRDISVGDDGYNTLTWKNKDKYCVHPDPKFQQEDLEDCRYVIEDNWMTVDEVKNILDVDVSDEDPEWWKFIISELDDESKRSGESDYKRGDRYLVCEMEERLNLRITICEIDGKNYKLTEEEIEKAEASGKRVRRIKKSFQKRIHKSAVVPHFEQVVLEDKFETVATGHFSYFYFHSFTDMMKKSDQPSWAHLMLDVMDRINKGKSQEVDYMTQKLGGVWLVPSTDKQAQEDLKNSGGKPNALVRVQSMKNPPRRENLSGEGASVQVIQQGVFADLAFIEEISNITLAMQGRGGKSAESGKLFDSKLEQSLVSSNPFYEIKNNVNKRIVSDFLKCVPFIYFEDYRLIEVKHNKSLEEEMVNIRVGDEVFNDVRTALFRAVLDSVENTPNRRRQSFEEGVEFWGWAAGVGAIHPAFIPLPALIINSSMRDKKSMAEAAMAAQEARQEQMIQEEAARAVGK